MKLAGNRAEQGVFVCLFVFNWTVIVKLIDGILIQGRNGREEKS